MVTGWPNLASPADNVFFFIMGISVTLLVGITVVMIYFVIRYNRKRNPNPEDVKENLPLEILWTVVPTILVLLIFYVGWKGFAYMRTVPPGAMPIKVTARQWSWTFEYQNGKQSNTLKVPLKQPIELILTSADVLHSCFIPAYRIKEDCVPGMQTHLWFQPDQVGSYDLFCTEYCGVGHSAMITKVDVMPVQDFNAWYQGNPVQEKRQAPADSSQKPAETTEGAKLVAGKGCIGCHSIDGSKSIGPSFRNLFGKKETIVTGGQEREIIINDTYIRRHIKDPQADTAKGYPKVMPAVQLSEQEVNAIIDYLKALR